jgi:biotin transport system substrate-specific component
MTTVAPENDLVAIPAVRGRSRTQNLVAAALMTAVMAIVGPVAVNAGSVPVTLQIFPVALAAMVLPAEWAAASMLVYLVMGAVGIPVYAGGHAGLGALLGPTGGYIFGFVAAAAVGALVRVLVSKRMHAAVADVACAVVTVGVVYVVGWGWLVLGPTHLSPLAGFVGGVVPFVVPDLVKAGVAVLVAGAIRRATTR